MTSYITCPACNYTRQPTDDTPEWECPNCQKAYFKTAQFTQHKETGFQSVNPNQSSQTGSAITVVILAASALFTLGMMIYASRPWRNESYLVIGWIGFMLGFGTWAISPYLMLGFQVKKTSTSARQSLTLLLGTILVAAFGVYGTLDSMFVHSDPQGAIFVYLILPGLQWIGVCVTMGIAGII